LHFSTGFALGLGWAMLIAMSIFSAITASLRRGGGGTGTHHAARDFLLGDRQQIYSVMNFCIISVVA
jgi:hypothetical protein